MAVGGQGGTGEGRWKHGNNPHQWSGKGKRDLGPRRFMLCPEDKAEGQAQGSRAAKRSAWQSYQFCQARARPRFGRKGTRSLIQKYWSQCLKNLESSDSTEEVAHSSPLKSRMSYFLKTRGFCLARHILSSGSLYSLPSWPRYNITRCEKGENGQYGEHCFGKRTYGHLLQGVKAREHKLGWVRVDLHGAPSCDQDRINQGSTPGTEVQSCLLLETQTQWWSSWSDVKMREQ